jgi:hypothetical protein
MKALALACDLLSRIIPRNWEVRRRLRRAETEATIAAERIEIAWILAGIASCQLRNAVLDHGPLSSHPGLHAYHEQLLKTLTNISREEMYRFCERTEDRR